jgi:hypothetical protein
LDKPENDGLSKALDYIMMGGMRWKELKKRETVRR